MFAFGKTEAPIYFWIFKMFRLPAFIGLLLRHGALHPRSPDYAQIKKRHLEGLEMWLPPNYFTAQGHVPSNFRAFVSLMLSVFRRTGRGHLLHPNRPLYYIRIPRSAGTSLAYTILSTSFLQLPPLTPLQVNLLCDAWLRQKIDTSLRQRTGFAVVRHPLHRLVSVYRNFFECPRDDFFIYHGYLFNILPPQLTFDEFVKRITCIPVRWLDRHLLPQHTFLKPYLRRGLLVEIFRLEEPEALHAFLHRHNLELHHENASGGEYDYRAYYTAATRKRALELYAYDCRVFGYEH